MRESRKTGLFPTSGNIPLEGVPKGTHQKKYLPPSQIQRNSGNRGGAQQREISGLRGESRRGEMRLQLRAIRRGRRVRSNGAPPPTGGCATRIVTRACVWWQKIFTSGEIGGSVCDFDWVHMDYRTTVGQLENRSEVSRLI
jgi:hypothetical protein